MTIELCRALESGRCHPPLILPLLIPVGLRAVSGISCVTAGFVLLSRPDFRDSRVFGATPQLSEAGSGLWA